MIASATVIVVGLTADRAPASPDRVASISARLRCPVCQGESIADSPSGIARELQGVVREQVAAGRSDAQIEAFFQQRYGGWVLLDPPRRGATLVLWVLPVVALAGGAAIVISFWSSRRRLVEDAAPEVGDANAVEDDPRPPDELVLDARRTARRSLVGSTALALACAAGAVAVSASLRGSGGEARAADRPTPSMTTAPGAGTGRDLSSVSEEEMEEVVSANPQVVPMRLALVERYLRKGELEAAERHADVALGLAAEPDDRQRALQLSGWLTALAGNPTEGAALLTKSLQLDPNDLDTQWFLANVRLTGLGDIAGAASLLEGMLTRELAPEKRTVIEAKLAEARATP